jgi:hypothetical protein
VPILVPPWFRAPLGSSQWCTSFRLAAVAGTTVLDLWFTHDRKTTVPLGWFAVVVAAWISAGDVDTDPTTSMPCLWRLRSRSELLLNDMPTQWSGASALVSPNVNHSVYVEPAPILAPIIIEQEKGATLEIYDDALSGDALRRVGWVAGWLCPRVNDEPGARSFFANSAKE